MAPLIVEHFSNTYNMVLVNKTSTMDRIMKVTGNKENSMVKVLKNGAATPNIMVTGLMVKSMGKE